VMTFFPCFCGIIFTLASLNSRQSSFPLKKRSRNTARAAHSLCGWLPMAMLKSARLNISPGTFIAPMTTITSFPVFLTLSKTPLLSTFSPYMVRWQTVPPFRFHSLIASFHGVPISIVMRPPHLSERPSTVSLTLLSIVSAKIIDETPKALATRQTCEVSLRSRECLCPHLSTTTFGSLVSILSSRVLISDCYL